MGTSAMERIGVAIDVEANSQAIPAVVAQANAAAASIGTMGKAMTVTAEQSRQAWSRAAGDFEKFKQELAAIAGTQAKSTATTNTSTAATNRAAAAADRAAAAEQRRGMSVARAHEQALQMDAALGKQNVSTDTMSTKLRTGANAMSNLAYAASGAGASLQSATIMAGSFASSLASMSRNAAIAAGAAGIGALAVSIGALIGLAIEAKKKLAEIPEGVVNETTRKHVENLKTIAAVRADMARTDALASAAADASGRNAAGVGNAAMLKRSVDLRARSQLLQLRLVELQDEEGKKIEATNAKLADKMRIERKTAGDLQHALIRDVVDLSARNEDAFAKRRIAAQAVYEDEIARVRELTTVSLDGQNQIIALAAMRHRLTVQQIEEERAKRIAAIQSDIITKGTEKIVSRGDQAQKDAADAVAAEDKIRKARRDTLTQSAGYAKTLTSVMIDSGSRQVRAIGHAADAIRRILIGAEAAHAAVLALKEGAAAIGSAAVGDLRGAALHGASSLQYAAAAALAAQESLGGGRSAGGAGGGSAGGGGATFEANAQPGAGSFTLQLITRDPYGRDAIAETQFQLTRAGALKRTIPIAPTTGLIAVGF